MDAELHKALEGRLGKAEQIAALKRVIAWQVQAAFGPARIVGAGRVRVSSGPAGRPMIRA